MSMPTSHGQRGRATAAWSTGARSTCGSSPPGGNRSTRTPTSSSSASSCCGRSLMQLDVRFTAVPVEAMRAFLEPLGYRFEWGPELEGIGFHWQKQPLSGSGVRATYFPEGEEGLLVIETDGL